jgi:phosphohistidine phosphatase SixA
MARYVLLVRHASREDRWFLAESDQELFDNKDPELSDYEAHGRRRTFALAGRLAEELRKEGRKVTEIWCSDYLIARQTAEIHEHVLKHHDLLENDQKPMVCKQLTPETTRQDEDDIVKALREGSRDGGCYILVGHQPTLTNIGYGLLDDKMPSDTIPIAGSEIACIRLEDDSRLMWLLTAKSNDLLVELREKIGSKYDVAKFFLGAFIINTAIILSSDIWKRDNPINNIFAGLAVIASACSLFLTAFTLFSYDELLMPSAFWGSRTHKRSGGIDLLQREKNDWPVWSVRRPPSQSHVVLYYEMIHIWHSFFLRALIFAFIAIWFSARLYTPVINLSCISIKKSMVSAYNWRRKQTKTA